MPFDRDAVAVIEPAEIAEHEMPCQRGRFAGDALHHVAVTAHREDVVVENREIRAIERLCQPLRSDRHADAVSAALPEWTGRRFDTGCVPIFWVTGAFTVE